MGEVVMSKADSLTKRERDLCERMFAAEIACAMGEQRVPFIHVGRARDRERLLSRGLAVEGKATIGRDALGAIEVSGLMLTERGRYLYCRECPEPRARSTDRAVPRGRREEALSERWLPKTKYDLVLGVKTEKAWVEFRALRGTLSPDILRAATDLLMLSTSNGKSAAPRPLDDWHEDDGPALWWRFPVDEPPFSGTPLDSDWPGYHTHWTPLPPVPAEPGGAP